MKISYLILGSFQVQSIDMSKGQFYAHYVRYGGLIVT